MKAPSILILIASVFACHVGFAQSGQVMDACTMDSKILESRRKYAVYLPPDYETSSRSYPVLYLLHGGGDEPG